MRRLRIQECLFSFSFMVSYLRRSQDSVVNILTRLSQAAGATTEESWFESGQGKEFFYPKRAARFRGPYTALFNGYRWLFPGVQSGRAVNLTTHFLYLDCELVELSFHFSVWLNELHKDSCTFILSKRLIFIHMCLLNYTYCVPAFP